MSHNILSPEAARSVKPVTWRTVERPQSEPVRTDILASHNPAVAEQVPSVPVMPVAEAEAQAREAYLRGCRETEERIRNQAAAQLQPTLDRLSAVLSSLVELRARLRRESEADLVRLAIAIAQRILHRELTVDPGAVQGLIKAALDKLQTREIARIRVHPDQEKIVRACVERAASSRKVEFLPDAGLKPWDILFETEGGSLDASINAQLSEIERGFADRLERR
jgi:flagellar assembly protein FliH